MCKLHLKNSSNLILIADIDMPAIEKSCKPLDYFLVETKAFPVFDLMRNLDSWRLSCIA